MMNPSKAKQKVLSRTEERSDQMREYDISTASCEVVTKSREVEERKTRLESVRQRKEELDKTMKEEQEKQEKLLYEIFLKNKEADQAVARAERARRESVEMDAVIERLKKEKAELLERKQEQQREMERYSEMNDFLERVVKRTQFKDVDELMNHIKSTLHVRDELLQRQKETYELEDQQRETLRTLQQQHKLMLLEKNNQLSQLQTELNKAQSEALKGEKEWDHILQTASKKTLELGRIKMATLNIYEMSCGKVEGATAVDVNDTEKQMDQVKMFIKDNTDIVKVCQSSLQRPKDEQKGDEVKKSTRNKSKK